MIVTLTANPSVDRTMELDKPIVRGDVFRAVSVGDEAGGKGVNVARAVAHAGVPALAVLPADDDDLLVKGLADAGVLPVNVPTGRPSRVNITVTEPDGTTTKFNDPGHEFGERVLAEVAARLLARSHAGDWVVLSGSLPPGAPTDWYADLTAELKGAGRRVAVDTSGAPLVATVRDRSTLPDLLKPNAEELASITGEDEASLEADPRAAVEVAATLVAGGIGSVLLTLGAAGAALVTSGRCMAGHSPSHHAQEHGRRRRRQPGRLPARRPPGPRWSWTTPGGGRVRRGRRLASRVDDAPRGRPRPRRRHHHRHHRPRHHNACHLSRRPIRHLSRRPIRHLT